MNYIEEAKRYLSVIAEKTNRPNLRLVYYKEDKGWKVEDLYSDGKFAGVFGFGCGNIERDIYCKIYGMYCAIGLAESGHLYKK